MLEYHFSSFVEWQTEDESVICYRITCDAFSRYTDFMQKNLRLQSSEMQVAMQNVMSEITKVLDDDWTVSTIDRSDASHWEHTIAVHEGGIWVLTAEDGGAAELAKLGVAVAPLGD